jgi:YidC/Oxa1 family membrane protein insertase
MDRKTWLVIGLSIATLLGWQYYYNTAYGPYLKQQQEELRRKQVAAAAAQAAAPTATPAPAAVPAATPVPGPATVPVMTSREEHLTSVGKKKGETAEYIFNNDTGGIEAVRLVKHTRDGGEAVTLNGDRRMPIGALALTAGTALGGFEMKVDGANNAVTFTKRAEDGLEIVKKFSLPPDGSAEAPYVAKLEITFSNPTAIALSRTGYFVSTGAAAQIHKLDMPMYTRFDYANGHGLLGRDVNAFSASAIPLIGIQLSAAHDTFSESLPDIEWAGVTSQYFCTILSAEPKAASVWAARFVMPGSPASAPVFGLQGALGFTGFTLDPQKSLTQKFTIYAGPKEGPRLEALPYNESAALNFGWFGFISEFLLWAMNALYGVVHDYGVAIILLTILIKLALWPLQNKATNSMRKMAALSPKMTEMREKFKDDPTKMNQEMMKLYRDYGVNPFSGCLPILIQIPIFFGFYGMLGIAVELRNSPFLWVSDLSQPDTIGHILGFPINILPLVMAGSMVWQMGISPKTGDAMQQRILMFMPVIFIAFAYNYASALSLYWTTQNLFSIVQLYLTRNKPLPTLEKMELATKKRQGSSASKPRKKRPK